jgi:ribosome-binding protein aMBF1 (putative translation factor)
MTIDPSPSRDVLLCPYCRLVQFRTTTGRCRRCQRFLEKIRSTPSDGVALSAEPLSKRIGAAIRSLRKERKLSQSQLADAMNTSRSYLSKLECGILVPSLQTLERATAALGTDIASLFHQLRQLPIVEARRTSIMGSIDDGFNTVADPST